MSADASQLTKWVKELLADPGFMRRYGAAGDLTYGKRRGIINTYYYSQVPRHYPNVYDRDQLRRYFDAHFGFPQAETNAYAQPPTLLPLPGEPQPDQPQPKSQPKEIPVSNKPLTIETKTYVNGVDIATLSDSAIYDRIASEEAKIAELDKIQAKPQRLHKEIEARRAGIQALVAYLDSKAD